MNKSTKISIFFATAGLAFLFKPELAIAQKGVSETAFYSLEKLCRKSGKTVLWLGSLDQSKKFSLGSLSVEDALRKLCAGNAASYSYDDTRFIFRKLDFLNLVDRPDFRNKSINDAYRVLASAPDNALQLMPDDYEKEMYGTEQEGASPSQFNAEGRVFIKTLVQQGFTSTKASDLFPGSKPTYSISANTYQSINWTIGKTDYAMNSWRTTSRSCSPNQQIVWRKTSDLAIEKFDGTLEGAIRKFGPTNSTIDPRLKDSHLFICYPKGTAKSIVFAQMQADIPFKLRNLARRVHVSCTSKDAVTYRLLTLSDKLYNKSRSCAYDGWQQFAYSNSPVRISDLTPGQEGFIKGFVKNHLSLFPGDTLQSIVKQGLFEKGTFSFVPQINFELRESVKMANGKTVVSTNEFPMNPSW